MALNVSRLVARALPWRRNPESSADLDGSVNQSAPVQKETRIIGLIEGVRFSSFVAGACIIISINLALTVTPHGAYGAFFFLACALFLLRYATSLSRDAIKDAEFKEIQKRHLLREIHRTNIGLVRLHIQNQFLEGLRAGGADEEEAGSATSSSVIPFNGKVH